MFVLFFRGCLISVSSVRKGEVYFMNILKYWTLTRENTVFGQKYFVKILHMELTAKYRLELFK